MAYFRRDPLILLLDREGLAGRGDASSLEAITPRPSSTTSWEFTGWAAIVSVFPEGQ